MQYLYYILAGLWVVFALICEESRAGCSISSTVCSAWRKGKRLTHRSSSSVFFKVKWCVVFQTWALSPCWVSLKSQFRSLGGKHLLPKLCQCLTGLFLLHTCVYCCLFTSPDALLCVALVGAAFSDIYYQERSWLLGEGLAWELLLLGDADAFEKISLC